MDVIAPVVGPETGIICFQNGVEGVDKLVARFGNRVVLPGATNTTAIATLVKGLVAVVVLYEIVRWNIPWSLGRAVRIVLGICMLVGLFLPRV